MKNTTYSQEDFRAKVEELQVQFNKLPLELNNTHQVSCLVRSISVYFNLIYANIQLKQACFWEGKTPEKKRFRIDILAENYPLLDNFFRELKRHQCSLWVKDLFISATSFIENTEEYPALSIGLIEQEEKHFKEEITNSVTLEDGDEIDSFVLKRLTLGLNLIQARKRLIENEILSDSDTIYEYVGMYLEYHTLRRIYKNEIVPAYNSFKFLWDDFEDNKLRKILIKSIISHNLKFLIEPVQSNVELLNENRHLFLDDELLILEGELNSPLVGIKGRDFTYRIGSLNDKKIINAECITIIRFTVACEGKEANTTPLRFSDGEVIFRRLKNAFADPIFRLASNLHIAGVSTNLMSDAVNTHTYGNTTITIKIGGLLNLDQDSFDDGFGEVDYSMKSALLGRKYYPHKEKAIKILWENYSEVYKRLYIKREEVSIDLFSNFVVDYVNRKDGTRFQRNFYFATNPNSGKINSNRFLDKLNTLNLSNSFEPLSKLARETKIVSNKSLKVFIEKCIDIVLRNGIELNEGHSYFWNLENGSKIPKSEPQIQSYILNVLAPVLSLIPIQVYREVQCANGKLDFLFTAQYGGDIIKTCMEVKLAHGNIEHGLTKQLPQYLNSQQVREGIYLVFWYKGDCYSEPTKFETITDLQSALDSASNPIFDISRIIIDCNRPKSPSTL